MSAEEVDRYLEDLEEPKRGTLEMLRRILLGEPVIVHSIERPSAQVARSRNAVLPTLRDF